MDYDNIFENYYTLYRAEAEAPESTDDEYIVGMRLANEAINHWATFDATYWKELFTTLQTDGGGAQTVSTGVTAYSAPANFAEAGGNVDVKNSSGDVVQRYPIIDPSDAQFRGSSSHYAYFTRGQNYYSTGTASQATTTVTGVGTTFTSAMVGMQIQYSTGEIATITGFTSTTSLTVSPSQTVDSTTYKIVNPGYTLNLNPAPQSNLDGLDIDYTYYKTPATYTTGLSQTEIPDPWFVIHRMLANRFRVSRNPYYQTAKADAENSLQKMQMDNNSGTWANPWQMSDNSGATWGK